MSILSEFVRNFRTSKVAATKTAFAKTAGWIARTAGLSDANVDAAVKTAETAVTEAQPAISAALYMLAKKAFPWVPDATAQAIAERLANGSIEGMDTAMSAFGSFVKEHN